MKFWPSGHSSVYTFVLKFRSRQETLRAQKILEGKISSAKILGPGMPEIRKVLEELQWAQRVREGNRLYIYSEFQTDFEAPMFERFVKWARMNPKLDVHYADYPMQTITFRYPVPVSSTGKKDLVKILPLLLPDDDRRIVDSLIRAGKLIKTDSSGLVFALSGAYCYMTGEKRVYPDDDRFNSFNLKEPWELLSVRHWMKYPPRTE